MEENVKETPICEIVKVKLKNEQLTVEYNERYVEANYVNAVTKSSQQFVHPDLKYAMDLLKPHVAAICEMPEARDVDVSDPSDDDLNEKLKSYVITGYSKGGSDESAGVTITAQKILASGQIFNITTPFTKFEDEMGDGYSFGQELASIVGRCDYEVDAYLFEEKFGIKQTSLDFDIQNEDAGDELKPEPKKRGRKKKVDITNDDIKVFDETA